MVACDVCSTLGNHGLSAAPAPCPSGCSDVPSGGYFVWLRLPPGTDGSALRSIAKQHRVDLRHVRFSPTGALGNHLRLGYAFYDDNERQRRGSLASGKRFKAPTQVLRCEVIGVSTTATIWNSTGRVTSRYCCQLVQKRCEIGL